jgi:hypothetical protein
MRRVLSAVTAALSLAACATAPTHYQPAAGPRAVGYSELRIEQGRYRITFQGGPGAPPAQVQDYALLRAADLALAEGYDWFEVTARTVQETGFSGSAVSFGVGGATFGRNSATSVGVSSGLPLSGGASLAASLEVLMGRGPRPPGPEVYDARSVRASIGARV